MTYKLRILSLGAGVQSSTLMLMAEKGEIEPFSCAIFADTGWESKGTYLWLEYLRSICRTPILTVKAAQDIYEHSMTAGFRRSHSKTEHQNFSIGPSEQKYDRAWLALKAKWSRPAAYRSKGPGSSIGSELDRLSWA